MNSQVIGLIKERIEKGKREYADEINPYDGRDWEVEALEELLDACVYLATAILKIKDKKSRGENDI